MKNQNQLSAIQKFTQDTVDKLNTHYMNTPLDEQIALFDELYKSQKVTSFSYVFTSYLHRIVVHKKSPHLFAELLFENEKNNWIPMPKTIKTLRENLITSDNLDSYLAIYQILKEKEQLNQMSEEFNHNKPKIKL